MPAVAFLVPAHAVLILARDEIADLGFKGCIRRSVSGRMSESTDCYRQLSM